MAAARLPDHRLQRYGRDHLHRGERPGVGEDRSGKVGARPHDVAGAPPPNLSGKGE